MMRRLRGIAPAQKRAEGEQIPSRIEGFRRFEKKRRVSERERRGKSEHSYD